MAFTLDASSKKGKSRSTSIQRVSSWFSRHSKDLSKPKPQKKSGVRIEKEVRSLQKNALRSEGKEKQYRSVQIPTDLVIERNGKVQNIDGDNVLISLKMNQMEECSLILPISVFKQGRFIQVGDFIRYRVFRAKHNNLRHVVERVARPALSAEDEKKIDEEIHQFLVQIGEVNDP